jgi:hypothetical protein
MTNARISKGVELASESLGIPVLVGEHGLCETVRETKGNKAGHDAFHKDQDFVWIAQENRNNGIISEFRREDKKPMYRSEDQDRHAFHGLLRVDDNCIKHRWWVPKPDRTECLVHFVKECIHSGNDPMEVMYSSAAGKVKSGTDENTVIWRRYMARHKLDDMELRRGLPRLLAEEQTNVKSGTKRSNSAMIEKGVATSTKKRSSTVVGRKRKERGGEDTNTDTINVRAEAQRTLVILIDD